MKNIVIAGLVLLIGVVALWGLTKDSARYTADDEYTKDSRVSKSDSDLKLYWFIPDGLRADPDTFTIYQWAEEGKLPNIKRLMDQGSYGYSIPTYPGHTPTNFATLLTGTLPEIHGVADGPMHIEGSPLSRVAVGGFRSQARYTTAVWSIFEELGEKVALLSLPGSTPPELDKGITLRGRWGGWGPDFFAVNFEKDVKTNRFNQGRAKRLFFFGPELTQYIDEQAADGWNSDITRQSYSDPKEVALSSWGATVYALLIDSSDDESENYDSVLISLDKETVLDTLTEGEWGAWHDVTLDYKQGDSVTNIDTQFAPSVIKLDDDGFFRLRLFYNNINELNVQPGTVATDITNDIGPAVDFVDNFPPQLINYEEDKQAFITEAHKSLEWHKNLVGSITRDKHDVDVVIHDIYTPNQYLTSRWWMGYIDPESNRYDTVNESERAALWDDVLIMYQKIDAVIGEILEQAGEDTVVVLSSDHGAIPLDHWVRVNNILADAGLLLFTIDEVTGEPIIDWANSQAIYLKFGHVYVNPNGLGGDYVREESDEYFALRDRVEAIFRSVADSRGVNPFGEIYVHEEAQEYVDLPPERAGDLIIINKPGYGWNEELTNDLRYFDEFPVKSGYKQSVIPSQTPGMWTPFMISGPGIKEDNFLGDPIRHIDQLPTILEAMDIDESDARVIKFSDLMQSEPLPVQQ